MEIIDKLKDNWYSLLNHYSIAKQWKDEVFNELSLKYNSNQRHYHNLNHISTLLSLADQFRNSIDDYDSFLFAIWFHDAIYNTHSSDNEEQSAEYGKKIMEQLAVSANKIDKVVAMILATKNHIKEYPEEDNDLKLFLDFDLKILGSPREEYKIYMKQIRKEYSLIPSLLYNPGRKKVLKKFLEAPSIYKTDYFRTNFEEKARANLEYEISQL